MASFLQFNVNSIKDLDIDAENFIFISLLRQKAVSLRLDAGFTPGILEDIEKIESESSKMLLSVDLKEVKKLKSKFVYNFFQKNERVSDSGVDNITNSNGEILYSAEINNKLLQIPRYNHITWEGTGGALTLLNELGDYDLNNINILKENIISTREMIRVNIKDEESNAILYENLESSLLLSQQVRQQDSSLDMANKALDIANDRAGLTGQSKKMLIEMFTNAKPQGLTFAATDYRAGSERISSNVDDNINFNLTFNKKFASEIIKTGARINENIFQNEFKSLIPAGESVTKKYLENTSNSEPGDNSELDFLLAIDEKYIYDKTILSPYTSPSELNSFDIRLAGYKIEKYELFTDGGITKFNDIYLNTPLFTQYNDVKIKYGSKYRYVVKSVYRIKKKFIGFFEGGNLPFFFEAIIYVESGGKTTSTECVELIPPNPPASFHVSFDYKNKLPILRWNFPSNTQKDIKKFQVFKRNNINEPFTVCAEYDFDDSIEKTTQILEQIIPQNKYILDKPVKKYIDYRFKENDSPIYAIAAVDAHGMTSNYSRQIKFSYNKRYNTIKSELVSIEGAPKHYPNVYINKDTFVDTMKSSGKDRLILFFDPEYYQVFKNNLDQESITDESENIERNLNLIAANATKPTYSIQILNIDNQKDAIINIRIKDMSSNYSESAVDVSLPPEDYLF